MNKLMLAAATAGLAFTSGMGSAFAQEEEAEWPNMRVAETWTCSYRDGKGRADLDKVNDAWNKWMDETGQSGYTAVIATPSFFSEWAFDVGWIGVAKDGATFGVVTDQWRNNGGELADQFNEVITCNSHQAWVSMNVDPGENDGDDEEDNNFVLSFADCSIKEDHTFDDYLAATKEWNTYAAEHGFKSAAWVWFPVSGVSGYEHDFKIVGGVDDYTTMGGNMQKFLDGHWRKSNEIFDDIVKCEGSRMYDATLIRNMNN